AVRGCSTASPAGSPKADWHSALAPARGKVDPEARRRAAPRAHSGTTTQREYQHGVAYPHRRRTFRSATLPSRQGRRAPRPEEVQAARRVYVSPQALSSCALVILSPFCTLPLSGDREQNAQSAFTRSGVRRRLHRELIDEQERHAAFDVI